MSWLWWLVVGFDAVLLLIAVGAYVWPAIARKNRAEDQPPVAPLSDVRPIPVRSRAFVPRPKRVAPPYRPGRRPFGG